jgi:hypothetical protein
MAETGFEQDLRHMFDQPAPAPEPDAMAFTAGVERRLDRGRWLRAALLAGFGLAGVAIALLLGLSPGQFQPILGHVNEAAADPALSLGEAGVWTAGGLLVLVAAVFFLRPATSEA